MTRLILHIGPHKTGTTYIQNTLNAISTVLADQGIYVPSVWSLAPDVSSHVQLVSAIQRRDLATLRSQLRNMLASHYRSVIVSSEDLSKLTYDEVRLLHDLAATADVEIVYYVRRCSERMPSLWQEKVKHGFAEPLPCYLAPFLNDAEQTAGFETTVLDAYASVFGAERIRIVSYSYLTDNEIDIAWHFLTRFTGLTDASLLSPDRPNSMLPMPCIELVRCLNAIHLERGGTPSTSIREWCLDHLSHPLASTLIDAMRPYLRTLVLDETRPPLNAVSEAIMQRYANSLVAPWQDETLYELRISEVPYVDEAYASATKVRGMVSELYETCQRDLSRSDDTLSPVATTPIMPDFTDDELINNGDPHLMADGKRIEAISASEHVWTFMIPAQTRSLRLRSHPAWQRTTDGSFSRKCLGLKLWSLAVSSDTDVFDVPLDHPALAEGMYEIEREAIDMPLRRWTDGDAVIPMALLGDNDTPIVLTIRGSLPMP